MAYLPIYDRRGCQHELYLNSQLQHWWKANFAEVIGLSQIFLFPPPLKNLTIILIPVLKMSLSLELSKKQMYRFMYSRFILIQCYSLDVMPSLDRPLVFIWWGARFKSAALSHYSFARYPSRFVRYMMIWSYLPWYLEHGVSNPIKALALKVLFRLTPNTQICQGDLHSKDLSLECMKTGHFMIWIFQTQMLNISVS